MDATSPLQGLTFLNTRDARGAAALAGRLEALGARVLPCPALELLPPTDWAPFDERLALLTPTDWIVFTSANAVRAALERLTPLGRSSADLGQAALAAIGGGTAAPLEAAGLTVALVPPTAQQESLLAALLERLQPGQSVWIPRALEARAVLEEGLRAAGHPVAVTPVYRAVAPSGGLGAARAELAAGAVDWIVFTSSSTVTHFLALLDDTTRGALLGRWPRVACIGAVTAQSVREAGLPVSVVPERQDLDGLVAAIVAAVGGGARAGD